MAKVMITKDIEMFIPPSAIESKKHFCPNCQNEYDCEIDNCKAKRNKYCLNCILSNVNNNSVTPFGDAKHE